MKTMMEQFEAMKDELNNLKVQANNTNMPDPNSQPTNNNQANNHPHSFNQNNNNFQANNQAQNSSFNFNSFTQTQSTSNSSNPNFGGNASANPGFGGAPPPQAPPHMNHVHRNNSSAADDRLNKTLDNLTFAMNEKINRVKITVDPPIYDAKVHQSMLSFGVRKFAMWAIKQSLSIKESTLFFCLCFSKRVQQEHVQSISKDQFGNPKFNNCAPRDGSSTYKNQVRSEGHKG